MSHRRGAPAYAPPKRTCGLAGKWCYESEAHARTARKRIKHSVDGESLKIYQCPHCWYWHLGSSI